MKKSKFIKLVLVAGLFVGCQSVDEKQRKLYMRTDTTDSYTKVYLQKPGYLFFYPYSTYSTTTRSYQHRGYFNNRLSRRSSSFYRYKRSNNFVFSSNYGNSKYSSSRGGFGGGRYSGG